MNAKILYLKNVKEGNNELLKVIIRDMEEKGYYKWMKTTTKIHGGVKFKK